MTTEGLEINLEVLAPDLLNDVLDDEMRRLVLERIASDLDPAIERGSRPEVLMDALGRILNSRPLTVDMWPAVERSVALALGRPAVLLLVWLVTEEQAVEGRLEEAASVLSPQAEKLIREILSRYSEPLVWAYFLWNNDLPDGWRTIDVNASQSIGGTKCLLDIKVAKVNGERLVFTSRPNDMLTFVQAILATVNRLPASLFTHAEAVESFLEQSRQSIDLLSREPEAESLGIEAGVSLPPAGDETAR